MKPTIAERIKIPDSYAFPFSTTLLCSDLAQIQMTYDKSYVHNVHVQGGWLVRMDRGMGEAH